MEDFFKNIDKERKEREKREKELSDSINRIQIVDAYKESKLGKPNILQFEAERNLLRLHDVDSQNRYRALRLDSSAEKATGNIQASNYFKYEAENLLINPPLKKKPKSDLF